MMLSVRNVALMALVVLVIGCDSAQGDVALTTVRDSAGITIVDNVFPDSAAIAWWSIEPAPVLDIGGADVDEAYALHQVRDAKRLADGRIVVANGSASDIRFYSGDGVHLLTSGRAGDGPGEFRYPMSLALLPGQAGLPGEAGDSIAVFDLRAGRVSVFDPNGTFVRDVPVPTLDEARARVVGTLGDGTFVGTASAAFGGEPVEGMTQVDMSVIAWTAPDSTRTLTSMPGPQRYINVTENSAGRIQSIEIYVPRFSPAAIVALGNDAIVTGNQDVPQLALYDATGALRRLIRTGAAVQPVTPEHIEAWVERRLQDVDPADRAAVRQREADLPHGATVPVFNDIVLDPHGNIWIQDYDDRISPAGAWSIHDPEGRIIARIRLPAGLVVHDIGDDYILGVENDDLDIQHVRMYRLRRGQSN